MVADKQRRWIEGRLCGRVEENLGKWMNGRMDGKEKR
jgi:hypothetical protein